ncbi:hypothetical protein P3X46_016349 [Hevea brasiliensis]|uniref:Endonuclease/exonuclease/phosphatase domain-containing protein n=1 Tax=Hevea brasiliensis TaxID=3981 RepID=A0ABQ9LYY4_HEVBR|nr:hypothetical protein P3X46_016349 [Hevea brasiliensis]
MSFFFWNCQGAGGASFLRTMRMYSQMYNPQILVLLEPRISGRKADLVIKKLGWPFSHRVEAMGFLRGIWILWQNGWSIKIKENNRQYVHMSVFEADSWSMDLTAIYGSPVANNRKFLWQNLINLGAKLEVPWRKGKRGSLRRGAGYRLFQRCFAELNLLDLGYKGPHFTWSRSGVWVRLDRALCNALWHMKFQEASVFHLPRMNSDHRPILL